MTSIRHPSRRLVIQAGAASAILGAPGLLLAQPKPVKIGLLHPVSGALAYSGGQSRMGGVWAIDEINATGGIRSMPVASRCRPHRQLPSTTHHS